MRRGSTVISRRRPPAGPSALKLARVAAGYTQAQLALEVDLPVSRFNLLEQGHCTPTAALAVRLARILGVTVRTIFPEHIEGEPDGRGVTSHAD